MNTELLLPLAKAGAGFNGQAANDFLAERVADLNGIEGVLALAAPASDQEALLALVDRAEVFVGREV